MSKTKKTIPVSECAKIGKNLGYDQVIIVAWDGTSGITSVATWGKNPAQCDQAALGGNMVKTALGWPEDECQLMPIRSQVRWFITEKKTIPLNEMVLGHHPDWKDEFNEDGIRQGFLQDHTDEGDNQFFISAVWNNEQDTFENDESLMPYCWKPLTKKDQFKIL